MEMETHPEPADKYVGAARWLAERVHSAPWTLLETSLISAEAARRRAFVDLSMDGQSPGLRSCFSVRPPSFESRTMIAINDCPSPAPQRMHSRRNGRVHHRALRSTAAGDQPNLLVSVAIRSIWPLRWCLLSAPCSCEYAKPPHYSRPPPVL